MLLDIEERGIVVESNGNLLLLFCVVVLYSSSIVKDQIGLASSISNIEVYERTSRCSNRRTPTASHAASP